jgi:hypothetical protein
MVIDCVKRMAQAFGRPDNKLRETREPDRRRHIALVFRHVRRRLAQPLATTV